MYMYDIHICILYHIYIYINPPLYSGHHAWSPMPNAKCDTFANWLRKNGPNVMKKSHFT